LIQKTSILGTSDITGVITVNCFHLYQNKKKKHTGFGRFIKISTRCVLSAYRKLRKKKFKAIVILLKYNFIKPDSSSIKFKKNTCIILKRRVIALSKLVTGVCPYNLRRKKFLTSFPKII
jgi:ribosomal protein L14